MELSTALYLLTSGVVAFILTGLIYFFITPRKNTPNSEPFFLKLESRDIIENFEGDSMPKTEE
jgi:hypothetical protein